MTIIDMRDKFGPRNLQCHLRCPVYEAYMTTGESQQAQGGVLGGEDYRTTKELAMQEFVDASDRECPGPQKAPGSRILSVLGMRAHEICGLTGVPQFTDVLTAHNDQAASHTEHSIHADGTLLRFTDELPFRPDGRIS